MGDVAVLCRNCHAHAHKDGNNAVPFHEIRSAKEAAKSEKTYQFLALWYLYSDSAPILIHRAIMHLREVAEPGAHDQRYKLEPQFKQRL